MNRLIILGNGFDLAHGMRTSFNDFISYYFCNAVNEFFEDGSYLDSLLEINFKKDFQYYDRKPPSATQKNIYDVTKRLIKSKDVNFKFNSLLLKELYSKTSDLRWVDIEIEYFNILLYTRQGHNGGNSSENIKKVNEQLEFLKKKLIDYLEIQQNLFSNNFDKSALSECFCEEIKNYDLVTIKLEKSILPKNLYFLNFNYTNTFKDYLKICKKQIPSDYNYIHGSLGNANGKPIFGFGDELDKNYLELEGDMNNALFKHIKSFEYLQTKNFYLLTRFIESDHFQIHIYGHSCGLSDRTMLNQIFEHENCKSIKIFYHKTDDETNDFTDKTYEISRHFKDKTM